LVFVTVACLVFAWFSRPQRVKILSHLYDFSDSVPATVELPGDGNEASTASQRDMTKLITGTEFVQSIVSKPMISQLATVKNHPSPAEWLRQQLQVEFADDSDVPAVSLTVLESQQQDGIEIVRAIVSEHQNRNLLARGKNEDTRRSKLDSQFDTMSRDLRTKMISFNEMANQRGAEDPEVKKLASAIERLNSKLSELSKELEAIDVESAGPIRIRLMEDIVVIPLGRW
jgi:hypothetical protein